MRKATIADRLPAEIKERIVTSNAVIGEVYRFHLDKREKVKDKNPGDGGRNKFFIVLGYDSAGNALGFVLIDTRINPGLPQKRKEMHYPLLASKYEFLKGINRFADCSDLKIISGKRFTELFGAEKAKGKIDADDLCLIKQTVAGYEDASPKLLKRFNLL